MCTNIETRSGAFNWNEASKQVYQSTRQWDACLLSLLLKDKMAQPQLQSKHQDQERDIFRRLYIPSQSRQRVLEIPVRSAPYIKGTRNATLRSIGERTKTRLVMPPPLGDLSKDQRTLAFVVIESESSEAIDEAAKTLQHMVATSSGQRQPHRDPLRELDLREKKSARVHPQPAPPSRVRALPYARPQGQQSSRGVLGVRCVQNSRDSGDLGESKLDQERFMIFVDMANILIGATVVSGPAPDKPWGKSEQDHSIRVDIHKLVDTLELGKSQHSISTRFVAGSVPPSNHITWQKWRDRGYTTRTGSLSKDGKEVFVDDALHAAMLLAIMRPKAMKDSLYQQTLVIATGDGNSNGSGNQDNVTSFPKIVEMALGIGMKVEQFTWKNSCSSVFREIARRHKGRYTIHFLDDYPQVTYLRGSQ